MHNNFYFLRQLSTALADRLTGFTLVSSFSQNKDELVIEFNNSQQSFFIKASLLPSFCCLSFPKEFHRARKNSIDLFDDLILKKVTGVRQFDNERSFSILLENNLSLLFKMHGPQSNVLLFKDSVLAGAFKASQNNYHISPHTLDRTIDFSLEHLIQNSATLKKSYFTFDKIVWKYLEERDFFKLDHKLQWKLIQETLEKLTKPQYYIVKENDKPVFTLLPNATAYKSFTNPIQAVTEFFYEYITQQAYFTEKNAILKRLSEAIKAGEQYVVKNLSKLKELEQDHHYQLWADLIMAYLHELKMGMDSVTLTDFYTQTPVVIKLKKDLNPQKNAEVFYRKAKNQQIEINKLKESASAKEKELKSLGALMEGLTAAQDLKAVRALAERQFPDARSAKQEKSKPYHEFEFRNYKILVGRDATSNDELTLKIANKEDHWLHAKDVAGSHVVIRHQAGKKTPKEVIERAAELAAYNSKRKTETLCPVSVTLKKYVRKRKGDPAGAVVVEREEVILVVPKL